jgi:phospholipase/carboxylesterase
MEPGMDASGTIDALAERLVAALEAFESAQRNYFPGIVPQLRMQFEPLAKTLAEARRALESAPASPRAEDARRVLLEASALCLDALETTTKTEWLEQALVNVRKAGRRIHRAQEMLLPLCPLLPAVDRFFLEPDARNGAAETRFDAGENPAERLFHEGLDTDPYARGSVSFYIPDGPEPLPLVVALHGGFGHGRDFLWTWLREARGRRFALACPTSLNITWSITGPDTDAALLQKVLGYAAGRWNIDRSRVLLTGLSDGATYALKRVLDAKTPFTHVAAFSGILAPFDLSHAKGRRIYWVHGAKDWMFPAWRARAGEKELDAAGADVTLEIVPDLYHAYAREKNGPVLDWFDPRLSPAPAGG